MGNDAEKKLRQWLKEFGCESACDVLVDAGSDSEIETTPHSGSRAVIVLQTRRGPFLVVSTLIDLFFCGDVVTECFSN